MFDGLIFPTLFDRDPLAILKNQKFIIGSNKILVLFVAKLIALKLPWCDAIRSIAMDSFPFEPDSFASPQIPTNIGHVITSYIPFFTIDLDVDTKIFGADFRMSW
jgi:hypothetical protein